MMDRRSLNVERSTSTGHRLTHYDGVCGNIHGHNMKWNVSVDVDMNESGEDNMPLDLKDISNTIDKVDHALLLNEDDPLLQEVDKELLGEVYTFEGDPTCEVMAKWMAEELVNLDAVHYVEVEVSETDKYSVETSAFDELVEAHPEEVDD